MEHINYIEPAKHLENISEYYLSVKLRYIAQMNDEGKDVINLGIGNPDLPPSEYVVNELCQVASRSDVHGYQPCVGDRKSVV